MQNSLNLFKIPAWIDLDRLQPAWIHPQEPLFQARCKQRDPKRCLVWPGMFVKYVVTKVSLTCDRLFWFHSGCIIIRCLWRRCCGRCCNPRRLEPSNFHSPGGSRNASWSLTKIWNSGQCHTSVVKSWQCSMLCSFLPQTGTSTQVGRHTAASAPESLPDTRLEVSDELKLFQLSTVRHSSLIWPLARMETVERMVLSQWSVLDSCIGTLYSVLVPFLQYILGIDVIWIVSQMLGQDIELEQVFALPAMWLGAGLLDECDEPSVGENNLVFGK